MPDSSAEHFPKPSKAIIWYVQAVQGHHSRVQAGQALKLQLGVLQVDQAVALETRMPWNG